MALFKGKLFSGNTTGASGQEVYPAVTDVKLGVVYGPNGIDFIGTLTTIGKKILYLFGD
tara:strand:- start:14304 stop:14480 length:177 start_codon:yes stop_codon:yes gene_type:complete